MYSILFYVNYMKMLCISVLDYNLVFMNMFLTTVDDTRNILLLFIYSMSIHSKG